MSMTLGLAVVVAVVAVGFVAYRLMKNAEPEASQEVVRVTRKNRAKQEQENAPS